MTEDEMNGSEEKFFVSKTIKQSLPHSEHLYRRVTNYVLGKNYRLSLVFIGKRQMRTINRKSRGKNKPTDVLSFPLSKNEGEIFINLDRAKSEAKKFARSLPNFTLYLLIHGLCHLKGLTHGVKMEGLERKYRKTFKV